jgi:DNA methylase
MGENGTIQLSKALLNAIQSKSPSQGYTHTFYKYPARFSPEFARAAIHMFTQPGDVVLDPFMGSGTTLVEALISGRHGIGTDISSLASFLTQVKTTVLTTNDCDVIWNWVKAIQPRLTLRQPPALIDYGMHEGYQRGIPWPIKKTIALILYELGHLPKLEQRKLVRCALLRTGQWALDCTKRFPSASEFREKFAETVQSCFQGLTEMREALEISLGGTIPQTICLNVPAEELHSALWNTSITKKPTLIVTSPPYPSVHVLYHRWQIKSRKEIPAPFWIADELDGNGCSYYTMGSRRNPTGLNNYFRSIENSFSHMHNLLADNAFVVQLLAFSNIEEQLPRYLTAMEHAGFQECEHTTEDEGKWARVWRQVPSRRWYATYKGNTPSSREVLLIHQRLP